LAEAHPILLDITDRVATITINRPQVKNSLDVEALSRLFTALGTCEDRSDVGAVVLPGAGDAFCAGDTLKGYGLCVRRARPGARKRHRRVQRECNLFCFLDGQWCRE